MKRHAWKPGLMAVLLGAAVAAALLAGRSAPLPGLAPFNVDRSRIALLGFSSGAVMAQQLHLAYSDRITGAVLVSGPPYQCAEGSLELALGRCMKEGTPGLDVARLAQRVQERSADGKLAPLDGLAGDRVLVVHGRDDVLVPEAAARAALALYETLPVAASMQLRWDGDGSFAHVWPTRDAAGECATVAPYIGNCGRDLAGEAMEALFGTPPAAATEAAGELRRFDQSGFGQDGADASLDAAGLQYLPSQCAAGQPCGLLIAFHGCEQNLATVGEAFARDSGLNRWADQHSVVVLYPQARATFMPLNPKACWDWWGYSGADYDTRAGVQLRAVAAMSAAVGAALAD